MSSGATNGAMIPSAAEIDGGMIYGLGALNMKAGLASMLIASEAIRRSNKRLKGDLIVACVVAETGGGVGALHLIESGCRPDYCIVTEAGNLDVGVISVGYVQGKITVLGEFKHRVPYVNPIEKVTKVIDAFSPSYVQIPAPARWWLAALPAASADSGLSIDGDPQHRALSGCDDGRV